MPAPELLLGGVLVLALIAYFLLGGADFGGGVWDLLARGPRKAQQRALIEHAIGPVWEANHVWLIFAAVLLFSAFPRGFAAITTALHVPLTAFLVGIVFRGSAFVFRSYDPERRHRWGRTFSIASVVAPVLLGMAVATIASGRIRLEHGAVVSGFFEPWLTSFAVVCGLLALALCAMLAATYLAYEAHTEELREDFRLRALLAGLAVMILAFAALPLAKQGAPRVFETLNDTGWPMLFHVITGAAAVLAFAALLRRWYGVARIAVAAQVTLIIAGWALSQFPYIVVPDLTLHEAASNPATLRLLVITAAIGVPILGPSLWVLFSIFKPRKQSG